MNVFLLLLSLGLVMLNGFFVATEFSMVKVRPTRIDALAAQGSAAARQTQRVLGKIDSYLAATQLGITLSSLGLGWVGEPAFASLIESGLEGPGWLTAATAHAIAIPVAFAVITFLHIVAGEQAPKYLAIQRPEDTALAVSFPLRAFHAVFYPAIWTLYSSARTVLRVLRLRPVSAQELAHSGEELRMILAAAAQAGGIARTQAELMTKALSFERRTARQMMVPRQAVIMLSTADSYDDNLRLARETGYTRFPLCEGDLDHVLGIVNIKDVLFDRDTKDLRPFAQPALFVPETSAADALLRQFRETGDRMAIVVDEYGGGSGIVTIEDLVAQVVGDISGEPPAAPKRRGPEILFDGATPIEEVGERLGVTVDPTDITTIAGWFQRELRRLPVRGDALPMGEYELRVEEVEGPRLRTVRVLRTPPAAAKGR